LADPSKVRSELPEYRGFVKVWWNVEPVKWILFRENIVGIKKGLIKEPYHIIKGRFLLRMKENLHKYLDIFKVRGYFP
jgi:hypothetical protein